MDNEEDAAQYSAHLVWKPDLLIVLHRMSNGHSVVGSDCYRYIYCTVTCNLTGPVYPQNAPSKVYQLLNLRFSFSYN